MFKSESKSSDCAFPGDFLLMQLFLQAWSDNSFTILHPVYVLTRDICGLLCNRFGCKDETEDLTQTVLILLSLAQYKGNCPIRPYITIIAKNQLRKTWKQTGSGKVYELDEKFSETRMAEDVDSLFNKVCSDLFMRKLVAANPDLIRDVIEACIDCFDNEKRFSREKVIKRLAAKNHRRHEVINAFDRLREQLRKFL